MPNQPIYHFGLTYPIGVLISFMFSLFAIASTIGTIVPALLSFLGSYQAGADKTTDTTRAGG